MGLMMTLSDVVETIIEPIFIGDDYSNQMIIKRPSGRYIITVEKIEESPRLG
jgi:hypothetical protein